MNRKQGRVQVSKLRSQLKETVERVVSGDRVIVERYGGVSVAIVPMEDYHTLDQIDARAQSTTTSHSKEKTMTHRLVITNISGGEGKTTLAREFAFTLQARGYRVALIDTDPQGSLSKSLGLHDDLSPDAPGRQAEHSIFPIFQAEDSPRLGDPINVRGVDVWASNDHLYKVDLQIGADFALQGYLREALNAIEGRYDFILIDTKPGISPLLNAAVAAANHLIVPVSGDKGMENLDKLSRLTRAARVYSPELKVRLFVPNRQKANTLLSKAVFQDLQNYVQDGPLSRPIRDSVMIGEAARVRKSVADHAPNSDVAADIGHVVDDLLFQLGVVIDPVRTAVKVTASAAVAR